MKAIFSFISFPFQAISWPQVLRHQGRGVFGAHCFQSVIGQMRAGYYPFENGLIYNLSQRVFATCSSKESSIKSANFSTGYSAPQDLQVK